MEEEEDTNTPPPFYRIERACKITQGSQGHSVIMNAENSQF
jgi:hypothetical protein